MKQEDGVSETTNEEKELQSSVVPWPLTPDTSSVSVHSDTYVPAGMNVEIKKNDADSRKRHEMRRDDEDTIKDTDATKTPQTNSLRTHVQTHTKDQQLRQEERLLLAKLHQMTGDVSPVAAPRAVKLLIPDPCDLDTVELVDHTQRLIIDTLQEISLTEAEQKAANHLGQNPNTEEDV